MSPSISWSVDAARLDGILNVSLWNLTGISAVLLQRCLSNFRAIGKVRIRILRLRDLAVIIQTIYFQLLQLPSGEWPAQVIFDPRSHQEHIVYIVKSSRTAFFPVEKRHDTNGGTLYRYDVQEQTILQQLSGVICIQCLRDVEQLLVIQGENLNHDDSEIIFHIHSVVILDNASFTPLLKFTDNPDNGRPLHQMSFYLHTLALCSADFKTISFFTCCKGSMSDMLTLTLPKSCLPLMTLKEICRAAILQHTRVTGLKLLPLPESLKSFLHGY